MNYVRKDCVVNVIGHYIYSPFGEKLSTASPVIDLQALDKMSSVLNKSTLERAPGSRIYVQSTYF